MVRGAPPRNGKEAVSTRVFATQVPTASKESGLPKAFAMPEFWALSVSTYRPFLPVSPVRFPSVYEEPEPVSVAPLSDTGTPSHVSEKSLRSNPVTAVVPPYPELLLNATVTELTGKKVEDGSPWNVAIGTGERLVHVATASAAIGLPRASVMLEFSDLTVRTYRPLRPVSAERLPRV